MTFLPDGRSLSNEHGWNDYDFVDTSPKAARRYWRLSVSTEGEEPYAMLARSADDEGAFDDAVKLPRKMCNCLIGVAKARYGASL